MVLNEHINPLFMSSQRQSTPPPDPCNVVDLTQRSPMAPDIGQLDPNKDPNFVFYFDSEFYVPDKEEKSGYGLFKGTHCKVNWDSTQFDLKGLMAACAKAAKNDDTGKSMTTVIRKSISKDSGKWTAYISKTKTFPKAKINSRQLLTPENIRTWVEEAHAHYPLKEAGITYVALHPDKIKAQQKKAARVEAITALAERNEADRAERKRKLRPSTQTQADHSDSEKDEPANYFSDDGNSVSTNDSEKCPDNAWASELVKHHKLDVNYDDNYAPIVDPTNPRRYFALTLAKAMEWAKCRNNDEVDFDHPPAHMKYDLIKKADKAPKDTPPASGQPFDASAITNLLVGVVGAIATAHSPQKPTSTPAAEIKEPEHHQGPSNQTAPTTASPPPSSSPPIVYDPAGPNGIDDFLEFCRLPPNIYTQTRKLLIDAGVSDHRHINKDDLSREELTAKGLNKIAINTLYTNATKYKKRCIAQRRLLRQSR